MIVTSGWKKLTRNLLHLVWKRMKDLLYLGSRHTGELPEYYGFTGDHVGTDAFGMHTSLPLPSATPAVDEGCTSQLHQSSKPQLALERFQHHQPVVKYYLAEIHP
jgi:hypothetical protein